jgi:hypothetical protein
MMNGFSGYNQVAMHLDDKDNISFTTPWGNFMYEKIPFGLINCWHRGKPRVQRYNNAPTKP